MLKVETTLDNRYYIMSIIKLVGPSCIYKAKDTRLNKIYAIKELLCPANKKSEDIEYAIKRFKEEANLLSELSHPNLPRVTDYFVSGNYYIVMDFIEGIDLETLLVNSNNKPIDQYKVINWAIQICDVLNYLHNQKPEPIIYRDMKPSNIMLREGTNNIVLVDFGIARRLGTDATITAVGTMEYAPMEQYYGKSEPRSDVYSLGATMHHLLTGEFPRPLNFSPIKNHYPDILPELEEIVTKAVSIEPDDRFQTAKEMQEALIKTKTLKNSNIKTETSSNKSPHHLKPETILDNRYYIISIIKRGGGSFIYKAKDTRLNKIHAIKELLCPAYKKPEDMEYAIKRFKEEANLLSELSHPNLPRVTDYFVTDNYYIVMDFIEGIDLEALLVNSDYKPIEQYNVINWATQICDVLNYLHSQKPEPIIYRDMKPSNIMLREGTNNVVLVDFGIARRLGTDAITTAVGTIEYAPIEQYYGRTEPRSDIYSLGVTMFHLLTGELPEPNKQIPPVRSLCSNILPDIEAIVEKAVSPELNDRFQTAKEMQEALIMIRDLKDNNIKPKTLVNPIPDLLIMETYDGEKLIEELKKGNKTAAIILGRKGINKAVNPLLEALKSKNSDLRREAAIALGKIGDPAAIPHLVNLLTNEHDSGKIQIEEALKQLEYTECKKSNPFWVTLIKKLKLLLRP